MSYDLNNSSAAAAPRIQNVINAANVKDNERQQKWYASGKRAKHKGFSETSPFYENATADYFFKCGYDGVSFEEAQKLLKDKIQQEIESNPEISSTLNELSSKI